MLTNIQRKVIRPPGHTGKARKGHMCFDGSHETMNLGKVGFITDQEYDIYIRPDSANPRNRSGTRSLFLPFKSPRQYTSMQSTGREALPAFVGCGIVKFPRCCRR